MGVARSWGRLDGKRLERGWALPSRRPTPGSNFCLFCSGYSWRELCLTRLVRGPRKMKRKTSGRWSAGCGTGLSLCPMEPTCPKYPRDASTTPGTSFEINKAAVLTAAPWIIPDVKPFANDPRGISRGPHVLQAGSNVIGCALCAANAPRLRMLPWERELCAGRIASRVVLICKLAEDLEIVKRVSSPLELLGRPTRKIVCCRRDVIVRKNEYIS